MRIARVLGPFLLPVVAASVVAACGGSSGDGRTPPPLPPPPAVTFELDGLDGRIVNRLYRRDSLVFAATDDGVFGKNGAGASWQPLGLSGRSVADLALVDSQHWLAATFAGGSSFDDPRLFETVNAGSNWSPVANDFGGDMPQSEGMFALFFDTGGQRLFATGPDALAMSDDLGRSWQLLDGAWGVLSQPQDALALNTVEEQVWAGGQNAIEELTLRRYDLATAQSESWSRLLPSPSTVKGLTLDPEDSQRIIASGEGGILQTRDNGATWDVILRDENSRFYFQTALEPGDPRVIYTAGWDKNFDDPQPLILEISRDAGASWEMHELDDPDLFGGVWSVLAVREEDATVVYLGLYRGGVAKARINDSQSG